MIDEKKYPKVAKFMSDHPGWTLDECIAYLEKLDDNAKKPDYESWSTEQLIAECKKRGLL
jgi:hypothetical protein